MAQSIFTVNFTLPIVFVAFLFFIEALRRIFFAPIMAIKQARKTHIRKINAEADHASAQTFRLQEQLREEELKTQRMIQETYHKQVSRADMRYAEEVSVRRQALQQELQRFKQSEAERTDALKQGVLPHTADIVALLRQKITG